MSIGLIAVLVVLIVAVAFVAGRAAFWIIQPYEQGIYIRLGNFQHTLDPGVNIVPPFISQVIKIDLRTQVLDVPRQEVITKDNSPTNVDAIIYIKVVDVSKAYFEVTNYKAATINLAQTTLRSVIGDMELDEILYNRERINTHLRQVLDEATDAWGVRVESVEIREVDPVAQVKDAMEEQTAAERQRRAAILRADGQKRSAILEAEGNRRSKILNAEGNRQSKILNAEGSRMARILEAQGGRIFSSEEIGFSRHKKTIKSNKEGKIKNIHNFPVNEIAKTAGCPKAKKAGIYFHKKFGESVSKDEKLFTIYSENESRLKRATKVVEEKRIFKIN